MKKLTPDQIAAQIALLRQAGWSVNDIAEKLQRTPRNIYQILERTTIEEPEA